MIGVELRSVMPTTPVRCQVHLSRSLRLRLRCGKGADLTPPLRLRHGAPVFCVPQNQPHHRSSVRTLAGTDTQSPTPSTSRKDQQMTNHSTDRPATDTGHPKRNPQECIVVYHGQPDGSVRRRVRTIRSLTTEDDGSHRPTGPQGVVGDENAPLASDPEEYRQEVHVYVKEGETEGRLYGGHLQLIRITLSDGGSYERQRRQHRQPAGRNLHYASGRCTPSHRAVARRHRPSRLPVCLTFTRASEQVSNSTSRTPEWANVNDVGLLSFEVSLCSC